MASAPGLLRVMLLLLPVLALAGRNAGAQASSLVVRGVDGVERRVEVREDARGARRLRADQLVDAVSGRLEGPAGGWVLRVRGVGLELRDDLPYARAGGRELPLLAPPRLDGERLWVPVQVATDVLPRLSGELSYDPVARVLRVGAQAVAGTGARAADDDAEPPSVRLPTIRGRRTSGAPPRDVRPSVPIEPATPARDVAPGPAGRRRHTVVVDAGHGGVDPGMTGRPAGAPVVVEKEVTLGVARALGETLAARGVGVVLTRTRDTLIALADRGHIANQSRGDLFVSIHVNAANPASRDAPAARGFETYFLSEARTDDARRVEAMENEAVRFETTARAGQGDPLGFVLRDMAQNEHLRESSRLAAVVQRRLGGVHPGPNLGVKQAGFKVLVSAYMPAVLVEVGFGTNASEAAYLTSARGQRELADAIADAVLEYLAEYDRKVRP
ncbi:MAG TPA: N-acetylmuramoyl-L-alanine amidase [Gemmatirosa sp.]|nr:N-acetylmuramoyl-L-alanine amidase [Gemmatirosa sp.]